MERVALGVKEVDALRGDEDRIAPGEFMLRRLVAGELHVDPVIAADRELHPKDSAKGSDALDPRAPAGMAVPEAAYLQVVRPDVDLGVGSQCDSRHRQRRFAFRSGAKLDRLQRQDVDLSQELGDERVLGPLVEVLGRANLLHPPLVQDDDLIGHLEGLSLIVGDEQAGHVNLVVQFSQPCAKLVADLGVESAKGFVKEQDLRPGAAHRARATRWRWPPES